MELLASGGWDAVSTRAIAEAAGTKPPAIYRIFGDKSGLLDAVAERGFEAYLAKKSQPRLAIGDPLESLRSGWDRHIEFGLENPALFSLMYGNPQPGEPSSAAKSALAMLAAGVNKLAAAGRLAVAERRAAELLHATGTGVVLALLEQPAATRDLSLSVTTREMVIRAITIDIPERVRAEPTSAAVTLRAQLPDLGALSAGERHVMGEWLDRVIAGTPD